MTLAQLARWLGDNGLALHVAFDRAHGGWCAELTHDNGEKQRVEGKATMETAIDRSVFNWERDHARV